MINPILNADKDISKTDWKQFWLSLESKKPYDFSRRFMFWSDAAFNPLFYVLKPRLMYKMFLGSTITDLTNRCEIDVSELNLEDSKCLTNAFARCSGLTNIKFIGGTNLLEGSDLQISFQDCPNLCDDAKTNIRDVFGIEHVIFYEDNRGMEEIHRESEIQLDFSNLEPFEALIINDISIGDYIDSIKMYATKICNNAEFGVYGTFADNIIVDACAGKPVDWWQQFQDYSYSTWYEDKDLPNATSPFKMTKYRLDMNEFNPQGFSDNTWKVKNGFCLFKNCSGLDKLTGKVKLNIGHSGCLSVNGMFSGCTDLEEFLEPIMTQYYATSIKTFDSVFLNCSSLVSVGNITMVPRLRPYIPFNGCSRLENITFTPANNISVDEAEARGIGYSIDFGDCENLSNESVKSILQALRTVPTEEGYNGNNQLAPQASITLHPDVITNYFDRGAQKIAERNGEFSDDSGWVHYCYTKIESGQSIYGIEQLEFDFYKEATWTWDSSTVGIDIFYEYSNGTSNSFQCYLKLLNKFKDQTQLNTYNHRKLKLILSDDAKSVSAQLFYYDGNDEVFSYNYPAEEQIIQFSLDISSGDDRPVLRLFDYINKTLIPLYWDRFPSSSLEVLKFTSSINVDHMQNIIVNYSLRQEEAILASLPTYNNTEDSTYWTLIKN